jgi:hypothetical protein
MARKGTKSSSRRSADGPVGFNECRAGLAHHAQVLGENLRKLGSKAPLKYYKTLVALNMAYGLVKNIGCAGPFMSFELPLLKGEVKPEKIKPLRRRR